MKLSKKLKKAIFRTGIVFVFSVIIIALIARVGSQSFGGHGTPWLEILKHPALYIYSLWSMITFPFFYYSLRK